MKKKIGLCFSGGGARGAYQIGVAQALDDIGIYKNVSVFSGTSIGAANVAVLASTSIKKVKDIWFNIPKDALRKSKPFLNKLKDEKLNVINSGIYTMDVFDEVLIKSIDNKNIKDKDVFITVSESGDESKGMFELVKSSYSHYIKKDSKVHYIPLKTLTKDETFKAVKASCSIPVVFPAITNEDKKYYDGGIFDNTPIKPLIEEGCEIVIVVGISFLDTTKIAKKKYPDVIFHQIKHKGNLGGVLDFNSKHSKQIYDYGYEDTIAYFKNKDINEK